MNFQKALKIWAHLCDYTSDCKYCVMDEFCHASPWSLGDAETSIMESILEKHNEEMLKSKYKNYIKEN